VPVQVLADDGLADMRWPAEIEGAAYFFAQEGIANVLKHAEATQAVAHISYDGGSLVVEVRDNGRGGLDPAGGTGLAGLSDRFEAFGGSISMVESEGWTRVRALLPAQVVPA
jgi:signal transduction histidine kinase